MMDLLEMIEKIAEIQAELKDNSKIAFIPIIPQDNWLYTPATYLRYNDREIAILHIGRELYIPCDPKTAVVYWRNPLPINICVHYAFTTLFKIPDEEYMKTKLEDERIYAETEKKYGPKPPTKFFEKDSPEAKKFLKQAEKAWKKEYGDNDFMD